VNWYAAGTYTLQYRVVDGYGKEATASRKVIVKPIRQPDEVKPEGKVVYLTFDDGPVKYTKRLLQILEQYNVKATFFVCGNSDLSLLDDIVAGGHTLALHSMSHEYDKIYSSEEAFFSDLYALQQVVYEKTGIKSNIMRFPGGSSNRVSKKYNVGIMTRLTQAVKDQGFRYFDWNVDSDDAGNTTTAEGVVQNVIKGIQNRDVSVVLQHDIKSYSVDAVEEIIIWGLQNGYTFMPLEQNSPKCEHEVRN
jgi:peptidoglycan/xylan/chitin deacetylase (PgdA/CDA1 family)